MHDAIRQLATLISFAQITRLKERARDASKSPRVFQILLALVIKARSSPPDLDGRAAVMTRRDVLEWLEAFQLPVSREALRKLLGTLQVARMVELSGSNVRVTRTLLDDLASVGACPAGQPPDLSGVTAPSPNSPNSSGTVEHALNSSGALPAQAVATPSGARSSHEAALPSGQAEQELLEFMKFIQMVAQVV